MKYGWMSFVLSTLLAGAQAHATEQPQQHTLCIFDVVGSQGDSFNLMKSYQLEAMKAGVNFRMRAYKDEAKAIEAFRAGRCSVMGIADIRVREFNRFTGSISAIGAVPYYSDLKILMHSLADRRTASKLENERYQILGVVPLGGIYLFVNDRSIDTVEDLKGKRITVLHDHADATHMINYVGAIPVPADITTFSNLFKAGQADVSYAPAAAYEVLEMYHGMGDKGGIVRYPLGQFTLQLVARQGVFDNQFVIRSRRIMADLYDTAMNMTWRYEQAIPSDRWVDIPQDAIAGYQEMLRGVRVQMVNGEIDQQDGPNNVYHPDMLRLLRKIRCHTNPGALECTATDKE